ncbi:MAG: hypothetical protein V8T45_08120 [Oscillospiraceae bacterium]
MGGGDTSQTKRIIGESSLYSQAEIEQMMDTVESTFRREFKGCTLLELKYDEALSQKQSGDWAEQYQADEAAVLTSSFDVDGSGGDGSLNPNSTYSKWLWVLTRNGDGNWKLELGDIRQKYNKVFFTLYISINFRNQLFSETKLKD